MKTKEQIEISQCNKQTSLKIFIVQKHEKLWYDFIKKGYSANGVRIKVNILFLALHFSKAAHIQMKNANKKNHIG